MNRKKKQSKAKIKSKEEKFLKGRKTKADVPDTDKDGCRDRTDHAC